MIPATGTATRIRQDGPGLDGFLRDARALAGRDAVVVLPAPTVPAETFLRMLPDPDAFLWSAPDGSRSAGSGAAFVVEARGARRFEAVQRAARRLFRGLTVVPAPGIAARAPRLYGGFSFAPGTAGKAPWTGFGDARFVLPRFRYASRPRGSRLSIAITAADTPAQVASLLAAVPDLLARLAAAGEVRVPHPPVRVESVRRADPVSWAADVDAARAAIREGQFQKVVLARRAMVSLSAPADPVDLVERLGEADERAWRFLFRTGSTAFVGRSPERLVTRRGDAVEADALAGTRSIETEDAADALLASRKERAEHAHVVRGIVEALRPWCVRVARPRIPGIRKLAHVVHLHTPVTGRLAGDTHVLRLVDALHPTPAVGGSPRLEALSWLAAREPDPRGWYAAPVGWFDADGHGEFSVAIRSCLLEGGHARPDGGGNGAGAARAHVWAGAGIVAASRADREYAEVDLKLTALLQGLGVQG